MFYLNNVFTHSLRNPYNISLSYLFLLPTFSPIHSHQNSTKINYLSYLSLFHFCLCFYLSVVSPLSYLSVSLFLCLFAFFLSLALFLLVYNSLISVLISVSAQLYDYLVQFTLINDSWKWVFPGW